MIVTAATPQTIIVQARPTRWRRENRFRLGEGHGRGEGIEVIEHWLSIVVALVNELTAYVEVLGPGQLDQREDLVNRVEGCHLAAHRTPRFRTKLGTRQELLVILVMIAVLSVVRRGRGRRWWVWLWLWAEV